MKKLLLCSSMALLLTACMSTPQKDSAEGSVDGAESAEQLSQIPQDGEYDAVVFPGPNLKGRFKKTPYSDVRGDTREFKDVKKVSVPLYVVNFDKKAGQSATASTGTFGTGPSTTANIKAVLAGVDEATMQRITENAYKDFVEKLRAAGMEPITIQDLQTSEAYQDWDADDYPKVKKGYSMYVPEGGRNPGKITVGIKWGKLMNETRAAIIQPEMVVNFATFGAKSRDNWSSNGTATAEVSMGPAVTVGANVTGTSFDEGSCDKLGRCYGKMLHAYTGQLVTSDIPFARIQDTTSSGAKVAMGFANALAMLGGTSTASSAEKTVFANPVAYEKAAMQALTEANTRIIDMIKRAEKVKD